MNATWIAPVHAAIVTYLIYREIGWVAFVPIAIIYLLQLVLAKIFALTICNEWTTLTSGLEESSTVDSLNFSHT